LYQNEISEMRTAFSGISFVILNKQGLTNRHLVAIIHSIL